MSGSELPPEGAPQPLVYGKRLDDLDTLARSPLLRGLGIRDVGTFLDRLDQIALPRGMTVMREGEAGEHLFFVLEGAGRIRRGRLELRRVGPGDHFGELALLGEAARPSTVEAETTMRLARLSRSRYLSLASSHPRVALHFTQALATALGREVIAYTDDIRLLARERTLPRRLQVRVGGAGGDALVATGTTVETVLAPAPPGARVVAATLDRRPVGLGAAILSDSALEPLTLASSEGRHVHRRSASLLLIEALRRIAPALRTRVASTLDDGVVLEVDVPDRAALATAAAAELARLVAEDAPLCDELWAVDEARAELVAAGDRAAAELLVTARAATAAINTCGRTLSVGLGPVFPRASFLGPFRVEPHPAGLLLHLAALEQDVPEDLSSAAGGSATNADGEMLPASEAWHRATGLTSAGALARRCVEGHVPELIRVAEGFHEKWAGRLADEVYARRDRLAVIAVAGPSSSGKTTFIKRLTVQLLVDGLRPQGLSMDDYYVDRERTPRDNDGALDFEALGAIDGELFRRHLRQLLRGEAVTTARYDFVAGRSIADGGPRLALGRGSVLLVEGIHGFAPELYGDAVPPERIFRIFVHPARSLMLDRTSVLGPEDVRLLRRLVRDRHQRNYDASQTIARWPSVRRAERLHVFPQLLRADAVFDSSLVYELSVLKPFAERYLLEVRPDDPSFTTAYRLRQLLDLFVSVDPDHVPPTSVIREFIGGSGFEY